MTSIDFFSMVDSLQTDKTPVAVSEFLVNHQGIQKYSLSSSSADSTYSWLSRQGFKMDSVKSYRTSTNPAKGWSRDDGGSQEKSVNFNEKNSEYLPQFLNRVNSDYEKTQKMWRTYYSYNRSFSKHSNGVIGISSIKVAVDTLSKAREKFQKMGLKEVEAKSTENRATFAVKRNQEIHLQTSVIENDEISKFLQERGSGVYSISFEVKF